ncbi:MAG TPA: hypothetical protein VNQ76_02475 [Planctomicrobium sp.]|nr:hypothetical protein [Planctomicrobium sp.]
MKRQMKWLAVVAMLMTAAPVMAQRPERGGPGGGDRQGLGPGRGFMGGQRGGAVGGKFGLLNNPAVENELAISKDQKEKLGALDSSYREALRPDGAPFEGLRDLPREEQQEKMAELGRALNEKRMKVEAEFAPKYAEVLDEVQLTRLQQIFWQMQGVGALRDAELAKSLKLSQAQQDQLTKLFAENAQQRGQFGQRRDGPPPSAEERDARRQQAQEEAEKRNATLMNVLTAEQKTEFEQLKGEAFDVSQLRGGPGGGRPGAGGPGGERRGRPEGGRPEGGRRGGPGGERGPRNPSL